MHLLNSMSSTCRLLLHLPEPIDSSRCSKRPAHCARSQAPNRILESPAQITINRSSLILIRSSAIWRCSRRTWPHLECPFRKKWLKRMTKTLSQGLLPLLQGLGHPKQSLLSLKPTLSSHKIKEQPKQSSRCEVKANGLPSQRLAKHSSNRRHLQDLPLVSRLERRLCHRIDPSQELRTSPDSQILPKDVMLLHSESVNTLKWPFKATTASPT